MASNQALTNGDALLAYRDAALAECRAAHFGRNASLADEEDAITDIADKLLVECGAAPAGRDTTIAKEEDALSDSSAIEGAPGAAG